VRIQHLIELSGWLDLGLRLVCKRTQIFSAFVLTQRNARVRCNESHRLALYCAPVVHELQLRIAFTVVWLPLHEVAIALHLPGATVVIEIGTQHLLNPLSKHWILDWGDGFHASVKVSAHPVGAADEDLRCSGITKPEDAGVLQETADDADHTYCFAVVR